MLTNEESLMVVVRNLEITHRVDGVVHEVDDNVKATKVLTEDIDGNTKATKVLIENVDDNVKGIEEITRSVDNGTPNFLFVFMYIRPFFSLCLNIVAHELKRLSLPDTPLSTVKDDTRSQGIRCKRNFDHGFPLQIPPSIIILHLKLTIVGRQRGLSKAAHSAIGRRMAPYYGSVEIVRL
jgi:hypothetical protein